MIDLAGSVGDGLLLADAAARMPTESSSRRHRLAIVLAGIALWLGPTKPAFAQATTSEGPQASTPSSLTSQQSAVAAPATTHPALTNDDVSPPQQTEGGPALPPPQDMPQMLKLEDALRVFRARGFGILLAEASVVSAEGAERAAAYVPNPQLNAGYGRVLNYSPTTVCAGPPAGAGCSPNQWTVGLSDNAAIEDSLSGKRHLRIKVARSALAAAKMNRVDAERTLVLQVKTAYFQVVQAEKAFEFAKDVQAASQHELDLNQERLTLGKINEGDFERIRQTTLEAMQAVDTASQDLRQAKVALGFLLGVRGRIPEYDVDKEALKFFVPQPIASNTADGLLKVAFDKRPDLRGLGFQEERAKASIDLARRQVFPDISVGVQYTQTGTGTSAIQPPTIGLSLTGNLPIFYQQQGEIRQAQADLATQSLTRGQTTSQVVSDVENAYAAYVGARTLVERMESALLASAKKALDITKLQWLAGKANLTDYLDARQAFIATNVEYFSDLTNYWTAVAQLEAAVGTELRQ
jgi:cobalt-zinc-cadmium efflux system outer membrane protein